MRHVPSEASRLPRGRPEAEGHRRIQALSHLVLGEGVPRAAGPGREPLAESAHELVPAELPVLVRVEGIQQGRLDHLLGVELRRPAVARPRPAEHLAFAPAGELVLHGGRPVLREGQERRGRTTAAELARRRQGLARDDRLEAGQLLGRLLLHGGPDRRRELRHPLRDPLRPGLLPGELGHRREVAVAERLDLEGTLQESLAALPGLADAVLHALGVVAAAPRAEAVVPVPRDEPEPARLRVEVDVVVLPDGQDAVEVAGPDRHRQEPGELVEVDVVADTGGELGVGRVRDEAAELDEAALLGLGQVGLRVVDLLVGLPVVAQVGEDVRGDRLQDRPALAELPVGEEVLVHVLDERVEAEVLRGRACRAP